MYSCGGGRDRRGVGDVEWHDEHVPSRYLPELLVAAGRDRDGGSAAGEFPGDRCADSAGSADDPGDLAVQLHAGSRVIWSWLTPR